MSADDYTRLRMTWLDQVYDDEALSKGVATNIAFFISKHFNRQRFKDSGIFSAWPSYATLAEKVGCTERTVQRAVGLLKARGHLKTKGKGGRNCTLTYFAILKRPAEAEASEDPEMTTQKGRHTCPRLNEDEVSATSKGGHSAPETWTLDGAKGGHPCPTNTLNKSLNEISDIGARTENEPTPQTLHPADRQKAREEGSELDVQRITPAAAAVAVLSALIKGPGPLPPPPPIVRRDPRPEWLMDHQAQHGWPNVYDNLGNPECWADAFDDLAYEMEPVAASKDNRLWREWAAVYRDRGWPLPPAHGQLVHFPDCGPKGFDGFLKRLEASLTDQAISEAGNVLRIASR
ncbi:helix-turn-helix domain-containing protein [Martelella lutilitoris]|uniref:Helix-turn-helix domain-containing protein n=1 Tax=Martelella lutilitoris TaxID=2583532 RepID=A0A5C4JS45_9HYPH|nr:helix-turn-helix domain-containing protein [Martelella lutilitoris]TNB48042.1 helix-turn-helix domain-containing protein [Martelella lutilitoris]